MSHNATRLADPRAINESGEASAAYGNLFVDATIKAVDTVISSTRKQPQY
jgi:hypothetical protein